MRAKLSPASSISQEHEPVAISGGENKSVSQKQGRLQGISIVCVYNNSEVRTECLDRSIEAYQGDIEVDYVPVDNTRRDFASAGAALNFGARQARCDVVAFAHQDVYLHSIDRLATVAAAFDDGGWALLGANGVAHDGDNIGRIRDRVQLLGRPAPTPVDVDSVDEVFFMAPRDLLLRHALSEDADLAWHAYAVEYSLRLRMLGQRVGAVDMAVTHNSLTVNLDRLAEAHEVVGATYPQFHPIYTTCGIIGNKSRLRSLPVLRSQGWRLRWLRHSLVAAKARQRMESTVVLSDIRHEIDLVPFSADSPLCLFNVDRASQFPRFASGPLLLNRLGRPVLMSAVSSIADLLRRLRDVPASYRVLIMGIDLDDLEEIDRQHRRDGDWVVGIHPDTIWLLGGMPSAELPAEWTRPQAVPFAFRRPRASVSRSARQAV